MLNNHLTSVIIVDDALEPVGYVNRFELIKYLYNELKPRDVLLNFSGLDIDYPTRSLLTSIITNHLNKVNYLAKNIKSINVYIKGLHAGSGVRKFELDLKVHSTTGITHGVKKVGYALREILEEAFDNVEKKMKKNYKKD
jgi:hypothetical protein